jgi:hypothetical protein
MANRLLDLLLGRQTSGRGDIQLPSESPNIDPRLLPQNAVFPGAQDRILNWNELSKLPREERKGYLGALQFGNMGPVNKLREQYGIGRPYGDIQLPNQKFVVNGQDNTALVHELFKRYQNKFGGKSLNQLDDADVNALYEMDMRGEK